MSPRHPFGVAAALVAVSAFLPVAAALEAPRCGAADLAEEIATNLSDTAYVHTALKALQDNAQGQPIAFQFNAGGHFHPEAGETIQFAIGRLTKLCR